MTEKTITQMLMENEHVIVSGSQSRIFPGGSLLTPDSLYVTDFRVIYRNPSMLGIKKDWQDFYYIDLANVKIHKGLFTSEIELISRFNGESTMLPAMKKKIAEEMFHMIQRERIRNMGVLSPQMR